MYGDEIQKVLITEEEIIEKCKELGKKLTEDYKSDSENLIVVGLLKGSVPFMAELIKHIQLPMEMDFMDVSSYDGTESVGNVKIVKDLENPINGKEILIVEDIVDTGRTLSEVKKLMYYKGADRVRIVTLLDKPDRRVTDIKVDYTGFVIPNEFVVGYGLDYNQKFRNLPYIGVLKPEVYEK